MIRLLILLLLLVSSCAKAVPVTLILSDCSGSVRWEDLRL